jgi:hypothetical protein
MIGAYRAWLRRRDVRILWPTLLAQEHGDAAKAREAFLIHTTKAPAWRALPREEVIRRVNNLALLARRRGEF